MTTPKREQRWCLCGWSVFGTELERANTLARHWASKKHKKQLGTSGQSVGVEIYLSKESAE